jgi:hypothetical protein
MVRNRQITTIRVAEAVRKSDVMLLIIERCLAFLETAKLIRRAKLATHLSLIYHAKIALL